MFSAHAVDHSNVDGIAVKFQTQKKNIRYYNGSSLLVELKCVLFKSNHIIPTITGINGLIC